MAFVDRIISARSNAALAIPGVVSGSKLLQVASNTVRLTQIRSLCDLGGELCKNAQKIAIGLSIQRCGVKTSIARDTVLSSISRNVASTRMRVLNVVDRVFVRTRSQ